MTPAERSRRYRDNRRGRPPRNPAPCPSVAAAKRHLRNGEPMDPACAEALRLYNAEAARRHRDRRKT